MNKKWIISLVLCNFLLGSVTTPVLAGLSKGSFVPVCTSESISTDSKVKIYSVKRGDTLWDISRSFQVSIDTVMVMNNLNKHSVLSVGQKLRIPYSRSRLHVVSKGETMWDIAGRYDITISALKMANKDKNPRCLSIGDKLVIPDSRHILLAKVDQPSRALTAPRSVFSWPLAGTITSRYGWRTSGFHHGLDIAGDVGAPIRAAAAGKVSFAAYKQIYGRTVEITHPDGYKTVYAHCNSIFVSPGQTVVKGQVIATVGTTGRTTGPHLHFEIKQGEKTYDPLKYLRR